MDYRLITFLLVSLLIISTIVTVLFGSSRESYNDGFTLKYKSLHNSVIHSSTSPLFPNQSFEESDLTCRHGTCRRSSVNQTINIPFLFHPSLSNNYVSIHD
jgi:hypothetical protein